MCPNFYFVMTKINLYEFVNIEAMKWYTPFQKVKVLHNVLLFVFLAYGVKMKSR